VHLAILQNEAALVAIVIQGDGCKASDGYFLDAGQSCAAANEFANEWRLLRGGSIDIGGWIVGHREPGAHGHYVLRIESELHLEQIVEAAQQKAGGNHEHQGERELGNDEQTARARLLA
jgi:hypothetical protein